jgi:hypothetical protein
MQEQDTYLINTEHETNLTAVEQTNTHFTKEKVTVATKRMKNWKAPGHDQLHSG